MTEQERRELIRRFNARDRLAIYSAAVRRAKDILAGRGTT